MSSNFHTSGYVTESDLKAITLEHNDKLNHKIKSTLRKIHKLKRENLVLSDRRKSLVSSVQLNGRIYLKTVSECILYGRDFSGIRNSCEDNTLKEIIIINKISERIGKNGNKIQRLRTKISQLKKSLIPVVDE